MAENGADRFVTGMVLGAVLGAAIGILLAPKPGTETRELVRNRAGEYFEIVRDRAGEYATPVRDRAGDVIGNARERVGNIRRRPAGDDIDEAVEIPGNEEA